MELSSFAATYGVLAIFGVMLLKEIGIPVPVPSDLLMVGAGVQIATGAYSLLALLVALTIAVFVGASIQYFLARSAGRAVVSTTLGAEGLGAVEGEHLLLADDAEHFAAAVLRLLNDHALRARLGGAGRALYEEQFTWPAAWRRLEEQGGI